MKPKSVILLRGLGRCSLHWGTFPQTLSSKLELPVKSLDLPGTGTLHHVSTPDRVEKIARSVFDQIQELGVPTPFLLIGHSLGGMVALALTNQFQNSVAGVIVMNTSSANTSLPLDRITPRGSHKLLRAATSFDLNKRERIIHELISNSPVDDKRIQEWVAIQNAFPIKLENFFKQLWAATRFIITHIDRPALVLSSTHDHMVKAACSQRLAKKLNVPCHVHATAGHDLALDAPDWVIAETYAFVTQIP